MVIMTTYRIEKYDTRKLGGVLTGTSLSAWYNDFTFHHTTLIEEVMLTYDQYKRNNPYGKYRLVMDIIGQVVKEG
jgi:hypothetical protein